LELPFAGVAMLASAVRGSGGQPRKPRSKGSQFLRAYSAFDALAANLSSAPRRLAAITMCWGRAHATRLRLWLLAVRRAAPGLAVLVLCFDKVSLTFCRSASTASSFCADARAWPRSSLSKLSGILVLLSLGIDALWLDTDTVVLRDPVPFLRPLHSSGEVPDMLFSVDADSWNCVNSGVFLLRAVPATRQFVAVWASLFLDRPLSSDQATLFLLLGLFPGMDFASVAAREGLLDPSAARARALGPHLTPSWGALDSQAHFATSFEATYGGIEVGRVSDLSVFHLMESWPRESLANPLYEDLHRAGIDPVRRLLEGILSSEVPLPGGGADVGVGGSHEDPVGVCSMPSDVRELLRRSERGWVEVQGAPGGRRDCRRSFEAGSR